MIQKLTHCWISSNTDGCCITNLIIFLMKCCNYIFQRTCYDSNALSLPVLLLQSSNVDFINFFTTAGIKQIAAGTVINGTTAWVNSRKQPHTKITSPARFWYADAVIGSLRRTSINVSQTRPFFRKSRPRGLCYGLEMVQMTSSGCSLSLKIARWNSLWLSCPWHRFCASQLSTGILSVFTTHIAKRVNVSPEYQRASEKFKKQNKKSFDDLVQYVQDHVVM